MRNGRRGVGRDGVRVGWDGVRVGWDGVGVVPGGA